MRDRLDEFLDAADPENIKDSLDEFLDSSDIQRGGVGFPVVRSEAKRIALERQKQRESEYPEFVQAQMLNDALKKQNLDSAYQMVPLHGSVGAVEEGYKTGQKVFGKNIAGKGLGAVFGGAMGLGTIFNPVTKAFSNVSRLAQASGESAGENLDDVKNILLKNALKPSSVLPVNAAVGATTDMVRKVLSGDVGGLAGQTLTGEREVLPDLKPKAYDTGSEIANTGLNFGSEIITQIRKDPVNAAMLLLGAKNPKVLETVKGLPKSTYETGKAIVTAPYELLRGRKPNEILTSVLDLTPTESQTIFSPKAIDEQYLPVLSAVKPKFKKGSGASGYFEATKNAANERMELTRAEVENGRPVFQEAEILNEAQGKLAEALGDNPDLAAKALSAEEIVGQLKGINNKNAMTRIRHIHDLLSNYYDKGFPGSTPNLKLALRAVRDAISDRIETVLGDAGLEKSQIYSPVGNMYKLMDRIADTYNLAESRKRGTIGKGSGRPLLEAVETGEHGPVKSIQQAAGSRVQRVTGGKPKHLDNQINALFSKIKEGKPLQAMRKPPKLVKDSTVQLEGAAKTLAEKAKRQRLVDEIQKKEVERQAAEERGIEQAKVEGSAKDLAERAQRQRLVDEIQRKEVERQATEGVNREEMSPEERSNFKKEMAATPEEMNRYLNEQANLKRRARSQEEAELLKKAVEMEMSPAMEQMVAAEISKLHPLERLDPVNARRLAIQKIYGID